MAVQRNLYIDQGSDFVSNITVSSSNGSPVNLANYTVKAQLRKSYGSSKYYSFTATIPDAANGKLRISLTAVASEAIPSGRWVYDIEITNTIDGSKRRVVEGLAIIAPESTKA